MKSIQRICWLIGNWASQIVCAFKIGYRDGHGMRSDARPKFTKDSSYD